MSILESARHIGEDQAGLTTLQSTRAEVLVGYGDLFVCRGITESQIEQLVAFTNNDELVARNTSDTSRRFANKEMFTSWRQKGRTIYTLAGESGNLGGIIWLGREALAPKEFMLSFDPAQYGFTLAMRMYGEARGKGLAKKFLVPVLREFMSENSNTQGDGIWIETSFDNIPVSKSFGKLGFVQVTEPDDKGKITMVGDFRTINESIERA